MAATDVGGWQGAVRRLRSMSWQRALTLALALAALLGLALGVQWLRQHNDGSRQQRAVAEAARVANLLALISAHQADGEFATAASLAASEPALPAAFRENARLARFETATLLESSRLPLGQSLDVEWLQAVAGTRPVLVAWGWTSGVNTIEVGATAGITHCGVMPGSPRVRLSPDGRWFSVLDLPTHTTALLQAPNCLQAQDQLSAWSAYIARQEERGAHVASVLPLPGPQLLIGWNDGRVEMLRGNAAPLPLARFDSAAVGLLANTAANAFALLSRNGRFELVDATGRALAKPLALQRTAASITRDEAWVAFVRDADVPATHALLLEQGAANGRAAAVLGLLSNPESASIALRDLPEGGAPVLDVAVTGTPYDGCAQLQILLGDRLVSHPLDSRCGSAAVAREIRLPGRWDSSAEAARGLPSGTFCEGGASIVMGGWHGELLWMRHVQPPAGTAPRIDIEHVERSSWDDPVTALACREDGSVHAGFRDAGIKAFRPQLHLQQRVVGVRTLKDYAEVFAEDQSWPVESMHGPARLEFHAETGELGLLRQGRVAWRRKLAEPAWPRPEPASDKVTAIVIDAPRSRVWVLTTLGRLSLLELNTGALLLRFGTSFHATAPSKEIALERPKLDASGQLSFVHRFRDIAVRVVVDEGGR